MATKKPAAKKSAAKTPAPKKTAKPVAAKPAAPTVASKPAPKPLRAKPVAVPSADELKFTIDSAFERRATLTLDEIEGSTRPVVNRVIDGLESGEFRVAEPDGHGGWKVNEWLKKAVLLYFRVNDMAVVEA